MTQKKSGFLPCHPWLLVPFRVSIDQLREAALRSVFSFLLIEKRQVVLIKSREELVPANRFQRITPRIPGIVNTQQPGAVLALRILNPRRMSTTFFYPTTNLVVIGCHF